MCLSFQNFDLVPFYIAIQCLAGYMLNVVEKNVGTTLRSLSCVVKFY